MPSIEELLNEAESHMAAQPVNDVLEINPETREISIPDSEIILGVETDQKAERKYFHCPKIVGNNIDLSALELYVVFQNASNKEEGKDRYHVTDVKTTSDGYITFSWELSAKVTAYKGDVQFVVCAIKTDSSGVKQNVWNTTIAIGKCLIGLSSDMSASEEQSASDLYTQLISELNSTASAKLAEVTTQIQTVGNNQVSNVNNAGATQVNNVQNKGTEVLASIPDTYTELDASVKQLNEQIRGKAPVITESTTIQSGSPTTVTDSVEMQLQGLRLYGKSKQVVTTGKNLSSIKSCQLSTNMVSSDIVPWTKKDRIYFSCDTENVDGSKISVICRYYNESKIRVGANGTILLADGTRKEISFRGVGASSHGGDVDLTTIEYVNIEIGLSSASTAASSVDNIMLCDEANQPYEPYTGGKPSPSPEYPQEIVSVGQKLSTGKNLVKIPDKEVGWTENIENITQITTLQNGYYVLSVKIELEQTLSEFNNTDICRISCFGGDGELIAQALKKWGDYTKRFLSIIITPDISLNKIKSVTLYGCGNDANGKTGMARFYDFQIEKGTEVTEYEPYTGGVPAPYRTDCGIEITGKNLLGLFDFHKCYVSETNKFVSNSSSVSYSCETKKLPEKIIFSGNNINRNNISYTNKKPEVGTLFDIVNVKENPITIKKEYKYVNIQVAYENTPDNVQIEKGTEATSYEPYKQSITTIPLPNGLPGIPVTTGGNYTDENGQQYICDEIDFARGKKVQRIWKDVFDGSSDEKWIYDNKQRARMILNNGNLGAYDQRDIASMCSNLLWNRNVYLDSNRENGYLINNNTFL